MSKVKKVFVVISSVMAVLVISFLVTTSSIKSNVSIAVGTPYSVVIFDHSTTGKELKKETTISNFKKEMNKLTNVSVFSKLVNGANISKKIYQDSDGKFAKYSTDLLNKNLVVEIIYDKMQDLIVYDGQDTRVVSYYCLSFVIPKTSDFTEIAVYYALTSNSTDNEKYNSYVSCTPLILYGNAETLSEFAGEVRATESAS